MNNLLMNGLSYIYMFIGIKNKIFIIFVNKFWSGRVYLFIVNSIYLFITVYNKIHNYVSWKWINKRDERWYLKMLYVKLA